MQIRAAQVSHPQNRRSRRWRWPILGLLLGGWVALICWLGAELTAEGLWFQELGYGVVFWQQLQTRLALGGLTLLVSAATLLGNLALARRQCLSDPDSIPLPRSRGLRLRWLLPLVLVLSLVMVLLVAFSGQLLLSQWSPQPPSLKTIQFLPQLNPAGLAKLLPQLAQIPLGVGVIALLVLGVLVFPRLLLPTLAASLSLELTLLFAGQWLTLLQFLNAASVSPTSSSATLPPVDPVFDRELGFYLFTLPLAELLQFGLVTLLLASLLLVALVYLLSADSLSQGSWPGLTLTQQWHVQVLGGVLLLALGFSYWLGRYDLLYSRRGVAYGASYTDIHVALPLRTACWLLCLLLGLWLLSQPLLARWLHRDKLQIHRRKPGRRFLLFMGLVFTLMLLAEPLLTRMVQTLVVQPNELQRELPYLERNIQNTRRAYGLEAIDAQPFNPRANLGYQDIRANDLTVRNIRLWDTRPLLETNRQLQQLRPYYRFPDASIDRYQLQIGESAPELRQVFLAARELDITALPKDAATWINRHLVYTHGYGFTVSPVNTAAEGGLPEYFVKDIGAGNNRGDLLTSSPGIAASLPTRHPRIYFGQLSQNHVYAPSRIQEFDHPTNEGNAYNTYDGKTGVAVNNLWRRLVFATYLRDWELLFTRSLTPQTRVLFRRQIQERVQTLAPFLQFDRQPYLVVADLNRDGVTSGRQEQENYLYWVIDAYTVSRHYPYADPGDAPFNYIRNSVKVVVDAYHGTTNFYAIDPTDPLLQTWSRAFPGLVQPLENLPAGLQRHLRYPVDLFQVQSQQLLKYHMQDPVVFYNQEDQWQIPTEIYDGQPQSVQPYYLITKLPDGPDEEFVLLYPFTPLRRPNLTAWLAARSDRQSYGKLLLYRFPKQELVFGPEQLEARINQDPSISAQISLWNREGSRVIQGNLLVIPIQQSLLYVEPLYLKAEQNSIPTLVRVIALYQDRIVMAPTLNQALAKLFPAPG